MAWAEGRKTKIATYTCIIFQGVWNLPHKFHLYLIFVQGEVETVFNGKKDSSDDRVLVKKISSSPEFKSWLG